MKRRLSSYFSFYMYSVFTILLSFGYVDNDLPSSFEYIEKTFKISGILIILVFMVSAIITGFVWIDYRIRATALIPLIVYGIATPFAYQAQTSGSRFWTGLVSGHFWSCFALLLIIQMLVLHDNHNMRMENAKLLKDIDKERLNLKDVEILVAKMGEVKSGTK